MKNINEATLQNLQTFQNVEEMNAQVKIHKEKLNQTDKKILDTISQYSCKYVGVSFLGKQKLAELAGFRTRRTAIRACNRMEKLGIIKQHETRREFGDKRRSVNIIVIQKIDELELAPEVAPNKSDDIVMQDQHEKIGLKTIIPKVFHKAFSPYFNADDLLETYYTMKRACKKAEALFLIEDYADDFLEKFFYVIRLYKKKKVRNLKAYLYQTWYDLAIGTNRQYALYNRLLPEVYYDEGWLAACGIDVSRIRPAE